MKNITKLTLIFLLLNFSFSMLHSQVSINEDNSEPDASAMLDVSSTDKGLLIPRLDSTARKNITSPADGLMVYDTSTVTFWYYDNNKWNEIRNGTNQLTASDLLSDIPTEPDFSCLSEVSREALFGGPMDMAILNNYIYVINRSSDDLKIVDISAANAPVQIASIGVSSFPRAITLSGDFAYIVDSSDENLSIIDISNPSQPAISDKLMLGDGPLDIVLSGTYAYVIDDDANNLYVVNISDPTNSVLLDSLGIGNTPTAIANSRNYLYVTDETDNDLKVIDISDTENPTLVDTLIIGGRPERIAISGNYAYVVDKGSKDLKVIDISSPTEISLTGSLGIGSSPEDITVEGNFAYITDQSSDDLKVVDVSDPTHPTLINDIAVGGLPIRVLKSGNFAYVAEFLDDRLHVFNLSCATPIGVNPLGQYFEPIEADKLGSGFISENGLTTAVSNDDDFVFGADSLNHGSGIERKFFFDKDRGAFRTGEINNDNWDTDSLGFSSFAAGTGTKASATAATALGEKTTASGLAATAMGTETVASGLAATAFGIRSLASGLYATSYGIETSASGTYATAFGERTSAENIATTTFGSFTVASGNFATAFGLETEASGNYATTFGESTTASGEHSTAFGGSTLASGRYTTVFGRSTTAPSYGETVMGVNNTTYTPASAAGFNEDDRLLVVGNGKTENDRSDALRIYKNGDAELNGALTIDNSYTLPTTDGAAGQVLQSDGNGNVSWTNVSPIGTIQMWPTSTAPDGWLICNGGTFNASTYPELNSVLGGNTLPNFNGRFPLGVGNSGTTGSTSHSIKSTGGEEQHFLTIGEMPSHNHGITYTGRNKSGSGGEVSDLESSSSTTTTENTGGNQAHNNMPPFYTINFIIKAE